MAKGEGARNGVYSSCFFLSFVDSALSSVAAAREQRESSALLHDKIALLRGKEKEREREKQKTLFHEEAKSARARHACPLLIHITFHRGDISLP